LLEPKNRQSAACCQFRVEAPMTWPLFSISRILKPSSSSVNGKAFFAVP
jgi:hypothetical protein